MHSFKLTVDGRMGGRREPGRAEHSSILGPPVAGAEVDRDPRITRGAGAQQKPAASPRSRSRSPACQIARWQTVRWQPSAARPLRGDVEAVWRANPLSGSNPGLRKQAVATLTTRPKMTTSTTNNILQVQARRAMGDAYAMRSPFSTGTPKPRTRAPTPDRRSWLHAKLHRRS